ncbi:DUF1684 domain-containing protein [bacterium]|nr:DUF1684 domain-containing protein [bacterium]
MKKLLPLLLLMSLGAAADEDDAAWRAAREQRLRQANGWLTLVGLFWIETGDNSLGSAPDCRFRLEAGPAHLGTYRWDGHQLSWLANGQETVCDPDEAEGSTVWRQGSISWYTIRRDGRLGLRVKDNDSPVRREFKGLEYYPFDPGWRLTGHFKAYPEAREMRSESVISGLEEVSQSPGEIEFERNGKRYSVQVSGDQQGYSLMFGDRSNGHGSYGAGRFLDIQAAHADGSVLLDFNRAYNPPCCWTPYATCPLPTPQNRLDFEVLAGEKFSGH